MMRIENILAKLVLGQSFGSLCGLVCPRQGHTVYASEIPAKMCLIGITGIIGKFGKTYVGFFSIARFA
jgi:hypothetical protein